MAKSMLGIDIGAGCLKLAQVNGGRPGRTVCVAMPDNLIREGRIVSYEAMGDFIRDTIKEAKLRAKHCSVILPAGQVFLRRVTMPLMTVDQLKVNLPYEFRDFLDQGKDKYFYDYLVNSITPSQGEEDPGTMDLTAAAVPKDVIRECRDMCRRAGLTMKSAIPMECAYANLLGYVDKGQGREYCILDLGHNKTGVYIFTGKRFETTRVIDLGMERADETIADFMGVDPHLARTYKETNYQQAREHERIQAIYQAVAVDIRRAVNFYSYSSQSSQLTHAWCCGGGANDPQLIRAINDMVELETASVAGLFSELEGGDDLIQTAAALGAALA